MTLEDIQSEEDVSRYVEGCLNDMYFGVTGKQETEILIHRLMIYLIKLDRKKNIHLREEPTTTQSPRS